MDSPASIRAAKWSTPSKGWPCSLASMKSFSRAPRSESSPSTNSTPCGINSRRPWLKLSKITGLCPLWERRPATVPPMYPAPPVINMFTKVLSFLCTLVYLESNTVGQGCDGFMPASLRPPRRRLTLLANVPLDFGVGIVLPAPWCKMRVEGSLTKKRDCGFPPGWP